MESNNIIGKWEVEGIYEYLKDKSEWIYIDKYKPGRVVWEFLDDGKFITYLDDAIDFESVYVYKDKKQKLLLDLSCIEIARNHNIRYIEHYRVEFKSSDEAWLYDLDEVEQEPDDYWLAVKINKVVPRPPIHGIIPS